MRKLTALLLTILLCLPIPALCETDAEVSVVDFGDFTLTLPASAIVQFTGEHPNALPAVIGLYGDYKIPKMIHAYRINSDYAAQLAVCTPEEEGARILDSLLQSFSDIGANITRAELISAEYADNRFSIVIELSAEAPHDGTHSPMSALMKHVIFLCGEEGGYSFTLTVGTAVDPNPSLENPMDYLDGILDTIVFK